MCVCVCVCLCASVCVCACALKPKWKPVRNYVCNSYAMGKISQDENNKLYKDSKWNIVGSCTLNLSEMAIKAVGEREKVINAHCNLIKFVFLTFWLTYHPSTILHCTNFAVVTPEYPDSFCLVLSNERDSVSGQWASIYILLTVELRTTKFMLFSGPKCQLNNLPNQNTMRHRQP